MQAMIFGIVDNGIMLLGALFGLSIEAYLPRPFRKGMGAIYGGAIGNAFSDFCAGLACADLALAIGTGVGRMIAMLLIPVFLIIKNNKPTN
jgi:hypothetical protein